MVFSEPPINTVRVTVAAGKARIGDVVSWAAPKGLADGSYVVGIRPHHVSPVRQSKSDAVIDGTVKVAELSGSESIIHFTAFGDDWVSLSHGVHPFDAGAAASLYADMSRCFYFDAAGRLAGGGEAGEAG